MYEHVTSPRVIVNIDDEKGCTVQHSDDQTESVCSKANSYCLYSLLQNVISSQHGSQNTYLETMSVVFDLPYHAERTINRDKKCATKA